MSYPNPTSGGPPLRALAMVLIALAIVFAGLGAMSLSSSDSDTSGAGDTSSTTSRAAATTAVATTNPPVQTTSSALSSSVSATTKPSTTTTTTAAATTTANRAVPVHVMNNSTVAGLAARTANELAANGWNVAEVGNYPGPNITNTTVYYGNNAGEKEAALAIADELGATAEPRPGGAGSGVTVVVTGN
ncbi:LytR C-terminal domain-containing protein [Nocardia sp. NPDC050412]|uniref:LytR C-terminal domain-containing protein n=1 Tax=Nocardia sp. NPDC050412 TaxID=3364320 RepID=UPI00378C2B30